MTLVTLQNPKYICVQADSCLPSAGIHKRLFALFFSHMEEMDWRNCSWVRQDWRPWGSVVRWELWMQAKLMAWLMLWCLHSVKGTCPWNLLYEQPSFSCDQHESLFKFLSSTFDVLSSLVGFIKWKVCGVSLLCFVTDVIQQLERKRGASPFVMICNWWVGLRKVLSCGNLSDAALKSIAVCTQMEELALHGCSRISNNGLRLLSAGSYTPSHFESYDGCVHQAFFKDFSPSKQAHMESCYSKLFQGHESNNGSLQEPIAGLQNKVLEVRKCIWYSAVVYEAHQEGGPV